MARLKKLEVSGFRAFGAAPQVLEFEKELAVVYAPNSHGKTSLAEAIEFLLSGSTCRRSLVGSAVREFADALRNAHLPSSGTVSVRASIEGADGLLRVVERKLLTDYSARGDCTSELTIDGKPADSVASLGITLAQPPLAAPILMPHGLRYVIQVEPTQRTAYFKMLLEMGDLDEVRKRIAGLQMEVTGGAASVLAMHGECARSPVFGARLGNCGPSKDTLRAALGEAIALAAGSPENMPAPLEDRVVYLKAVMAEKQGTAFPVEALRPGAGISWTQRGPEAFDDISAYHRLLTTIDADLGRVEALYTALLDIPVYGGLKASATAACPVCKTDNALTGVRIEEIRSALKSSSGVTTARRKATAALREIQDQVAGVTRILAATRPTLFSWDNAERARRGFSIEALAALLGDSGKKDFEEWRAAANGLREAVKASDAELKPHLATVAALELGTFDDAAIASVTVALTAIEKTVAAVGAAHQRYARAHTAVVDAVEPTVARKTNTMGWKTLLTLAADPDTLYAALREERAARAARAEFEKALKEIDGGIAEVLDSKYDQVGDEVSKWWRLMRPDTTTRFSGLQRVGTGRRYLDMKAGLFETDARPEPTAVRDAVAVFSDSQLNCLGLAAFLARSVRQRCGFLVLDDPFPGSDADHRTMFLDRVLPALAAEKIQVILLTFDDRAVADAQHMYADTGIDCFEIGLADPVAGATVARTKDDLDVMLAKANGLLLTSSTSAEARKLAASHLRDATERFCKLMVIKDRASKGTMTAMSELNLTLGVLVPMVDPLLTQNGGDPGKLRVIPGRINPGNHDDAAPDQMDLKQTYGTLKDFKKRYL